jgi:hypothetical protein
VGHIYVGVLGVGVKAPCRLQVGELWNSFHVFLEVATGMRCGGVCLTWVPQAIAVTADDSEDVTPLGYLLQSGW